MRRGDPKLSGKPSVSKSKQQSISNKTRLLVNRLTDVQTLKGRPVQITELELHNICLLLLEILSDEPSCLSVKLNQPLNVVGDIRGHFTELLQTLTEIGHPPNTRYLFLGNYVGSGERSVETVTLLLAYKLLYPNKVFLLRGCHESDQQGRACGFRTEFGTRFNSRLWDVLMDTFNYLPVTAIIENVIFCSHGGISPCVLYSGCENAKQLQNFINLWIPRPSEIETNLLLTHFIWSEPDAQTDGWERNPRGLGYLFGAKEVQQFCERFDFLQLIRSGDLVQNGYEFFVDKRLITVFSAPGYMKLYKND
ncbi:unnamed protein product, partial [Echinostoma caproni]|uniref:protein-serine/threonine phosphatase n=1 Tax=Echinostoma caproni TaxID=27848 RepID=A0A183BCG5_9TREM